MNKTRLETLNEHLNSFENKFVMPFMADFHNDEVEESYYMSEATFNDAIGLNTFISQNFNSEVNILILQTINRLQDKYIHENSHEALEEFREILIDTLYLQIYCEKEGEE